MANAVDTGLPARAERPNDPGTHKKEPDQKEKPETRGEWPPIESNFPQRPGKRCEEAMLRRPKTPLPNAG